jgi:hypothetical protein
MIMKVHSPLRVFAPSLLLLLTSFGPSLQTHSNPSAGSLPPPPPHMRAPLSNPPSAPPQPLADALAAAGPCAQRILPNTIQISPPSPHGLCALALPPSAAFSLDAILQIITPPNASLSLDASSSSVFLRGGGLNFVGGASVRVLNFQFFHGDTPRTALHFLGNFELFFNLLLRLRIRRLVKCFRPRRRGSHPERHVRR